MTSVTLIHVHDDVPALRRANAAGDRLKQKEAFAELYSGIFIPMSLCRSNFRSGRRTGWCSLAMQLGPHLHLPAKEISWQSWVLGY